jgi:nitrogen fixation protein FixH
LVFRPAEDGSYRAETTLWSGQWDIMLTVQTDGRQYSTTRRVIVK